MPPARAARSVVFDLGGVLIDWNPRFLYEHLIPDAEERERFLQEVCTQAWNEEQDAGRSIEEGTALLCAAYPDQQELITAYYGRWEEMLRGPVAGTPDILRAVERAGVPLYALTNWSAELFPIAERRFDFLSCFIDIVVSGREGVKKPDPRIYRILLERNRLEAEHTLFIDDNRANVEAARDLGLLAHHFTGAAALLADLEAQGLLPGAA